MSSQNEFIYNDVNVFCIEDDFQLRIPSEGWARRPTHGNYYGNDYVSNFDHDIRKMFERGENDSSMKMNPDVMHNKLKTMHPGKYSIPSTTSIKK